MIGFLWHKLEKRRFIAKSRVSERGIAFLTEGYTGTHINLEYELLLNDHPIALLHHHKGDRGQLYNCGSPRFYAPQNLVSQYVTQMLTGVPSTPSEMPELERSWGFSGCHAGSHDDYLINHRRPIALVIVEWEPGDWACPASLLLAKYPALEKLVFEIELRDDLAEDRELEEAIRQGMPTWESFSVLRATAYSTADRIGSVYAHPVDSGKWTGRNLFKERALFEDRSAAGAWVAISSLGGWSGMREYYERRFGSAVCYLGAAGQGSGRSAGKQHLRRR